MHITDRPHDAVTVNDHDVDFRGSYEDYLAGEELATA